MEPRALAALSGLAPWKRPEDRECSRITLFKMGVKGALPPWVASPYGERGSPLFFKKSVKKIPIMGKIYRQVSPCWERSSPTYSSSSLHRSPIVLSMAKAMMYVAMKVKMVTETAPITFAVKVWTLPSSSPE